MTRDTEIEARVLQALHQQAKGQRTEDSRVELKAEWPDPAKAARRVAGHANASGSDHVLWIIGVDEAGGVVSCPPVELSDWMAQLRACFDGVSPTVHDLLVPFGGAQVTALRFDTSRVPYVVKNPNKGKVVGEAVDLEVPWREGTGTRSARRDELLRILAETTLSPALEPLKALVSISRDEKDGRLRGWLQATYYLTPATAEAMVIPYHYCEATVTAGADRCIIRTPSLSEPRDDSFQSGSVSMSHTRTELHVAGAGAVEIHQHFRPDSIALEPHPTATLSLVVRPVRSRVPASAVCQLELFRANEKEIVWRLKDGSEE